MECNASAQALTKTNDPLNEVMGPLTLMLATLHKGGAKDNAWSLQSALALGAQFRPTMRIWRKQMILLLLQADVERRRKGGIYLSYSCPDDIK